MQKNINSLEIIFFDFDGVIKLSNEIKTQAYLDLFIAFNSSALIDRIKDHHQQNGGVSRYYKIPLYLEWALNSKNVDDKVSAEFIKDYGLLVKQKVINSEWVPGVLDFIINRKRLGTYIALVTATPTDEIIDILRSLEIIDYFDQIYGAPSTKFSAVRVCLDLYNVSSRQCLYFGDSAEDCLAAKKNRVPFMLVKNANNKNLIADSDGYIENFECYG